MSASSSSLLHAVQFITSMDHFRRGAEDNNKDSEEQQQQQQQPHTHSRSSAFNPPSIIRDSSAFSKPLLPSSSSLLSPKPTGSAHFNGSSSSAFLPGSGPGPDPYPSPARYRECLRNHAAALGGHVVDGCGEFMPAAPPSDPLKCAACGCHRSFHRREPEPEPEPGPGPGPPKAAAFRVPLLLPHHPNPLRLSGNTTDQSSSEERVHTPNTNNHHHYDYNSRHGQMGSGDEQGRKKRFRTKFSSDQKEKMRAFAERVGWRVQKKDEGEMERFCSEIGVSRQVLKVWMHNNKHLVRRQEEAMQLEGRSSESKVEDNERGLV